MKSWQVLAAVASVFTLFASAGAADKPNPRPHRIVGELTAVATDEITLKVTDKDGEKTLKFTLNDKTNVVIELDEDDVTTQKTSNGDVTVRMPKLKNGKVADLKTGLKVTVSTHDEKTASLVTIRRAPK
jgi:hypothetical protein